jgi:3-hydroxyisobutyrate dehydrogenase-like beta-hydroxyacid dehydrogenase
VKYLLTSLPTPGILEEVLTGEAGALHVMGQGTYVLDMSTTDVETTRRLNGYAKEKGITFFDCPVSGGPQGADLGTLTIMVGGDAEKYQNVQPVLQAVGKEIRYIGESGSGQVVKLCNNMVVAGITVLLSETFLTGGKAGVDVHTIAEVMQLGSAQNRVLSVFGPNLMEGTHDHVIFMLNHMAKDIELYMNLAKQGEIPHMVSSVVHQLFQAARKEGKGEMDTTAVSQVLEGMAKHKIVQTM